MNDVGGVTGEDPRYDEIRAWLNYSGNNDDHLAALIIETLLRLPSDVLPFLRDEFIFVTDRRNPRFPVATRKYFRGARELRPIGLANVDKLPADEAPTIIALAIAYAWCQREADIAPVDPADSWDTGEVDAVSPRWAFEQLQA